MPRVFSSIRKNLINEGKTSRYVRYAVGEFLLIVAGILAALQIQTWNEGRKVEQDRQELIENLKVDFTENHKTLNAQLLNAEERVRNMRQFLVDLFDEDKELSLEALRQSSRTFFMPANFVARMGAYRQATASGSIQLLEDNELIDFFHAYDSNNNRLLAVAEMRNQDFLEGPHGDS